MSKQIAKMLIITEVLGAKQEKARIDGKASRSFVGATFSEAIQGADGRYYPNPFRNSYRNIFQKHSTDGKTATWKVTPEQLNALKAGQLAIPGEVVTKKVKSFSVLDATGAQQKRKDGSLVFADRYTAVVLNGEDTATIFKASGHEIVGDVESSSSTAPASLVDLVA